MEPEKQGKTLWEMLCERVKGHSNGSGLPFYNPLDYRVGSAVKVVFANGPQFQDRDFTVKQILEYTRRIGGQEFRFADYVLEGIDTKAFDAAKTLTARLRAVPSPAGAATCLLLTVYDEFEFNEDFLAVVKDTTGIFEVEDEKSGVKETFERINKVEGSYEPVLLVVSETTPDGKAAPGKYAAAKLEYWDYWRDADIGAGHTAREFIFVEMNSETGWFQIWRGKEFFS